MEGKEDSQPQRHRAASSGRDDRQPPPASVQRLAIPLGLVAAVGLLVTLCVLFMVAAGLRAGRQGKVSIDCTSEAEGTQFLAAASEPKGAFYLDDQIILTGSSSDVHDVVSELGDASGDREAIDLEPAQECSIRAPEAQGGELSMNLYAITRGGSVEEVIRAVEGTWAGDAVAADPNYLVGILGRSSCGNPHSIGPSPHSIGPSPFELGAYPHSIGPSPFKLVGDPHSIGPSPAGPASQAAAAAFQSQWAFRQIGLAPSTRSGPGASGQGSMGDGVRVGVFDTSPFTIPFATGAAAAPPSTVKLGAAHGVTTTWDLELAFPFTNTMAALLPMPKGDIRDHGLFVAGLVHALAPESQIQLIRVLDEHGCGDLFTLNKALYTFIAGVAADRNKLDGAVINLSLGLQKPRAEDLVQKTNGPAQELQQEVPRPEVTMQILRDLTVLVEDEVESLEAAVLLAQDQGLVVVAAAGNDSWTGDIPLSPHLPAGYPSVMGVAGSNAGRQRSCFSNWGDLSAPAGDGSPDEALKAQVKAASGIESDCLPITGHCAGDCPTALISLVHHAHQGYAYWSGTSFAAPLVSGLAARVLDAGAQGCLLKRAWVSPDDVFSAVRCGAPTADGIINVPASLERCQP